MSEYIITGAQMEKMFKDIELTAEQQAIIRAVLQRELKTPKHHKDALGSAYYGALSSSDVWAWINNTGTFLALLSTSILDAGTENEKALIDREQKQWTIAMSLFGTKDDDTQKFRGAAMCQRILGNLGKLAYKYGNVPAMSFELPIPAKNGEKK